MPLSPDAKALLELILARGQSYEDIASLLEVPEAEVRARARAALTELGGADPDRNVALTDWVLGQADPITRADVARHVREDADDHRLAGELVAALRELSPEADLPKLPGEPAKGRGRRRSDARGAPPGKDAQLAAGGTPPPRGTTADGPSRLSSLSAQQSRLIFVLAGAAVLVVFVVIAVTGGFGGDDDSSTASTGADAGASTTTEASTAGDGATVALEPVAGGDASGALTVGVANQQAFLDVVARDLQAPPSGSAYILWFMQDEESGYPYQQIQVAGSGDVNERFVLPQEFVGAALSSRSVDVWISPTAKLQDLVPDALRDASVIKVPGERVLTADIQPIAEAAGLGTNPGGQTTTPDQ